MLPLIGSAISAGASLLGGFLNRDAQKDANAANAAQAAQNRADQYHFAENSIKMRVDDAERSGVHPVYALGAPGINFSPVSVGATPESGVGTALGGMGQDISRAVSSYRSPADKVSAVSLAQQSASNTLDLETKSLNNQLLRAKIAQITQPGTPPGVAFDVAEKTKADERPPLMAGGSRWLTNPNTSPAKAYEDQYGDDGPASWLINAGILGNDAVYNIKKNLPSNRDAARPDFSALPGRVQQWLARARWRTTE